MRNWAGNLEYATADVRRPRSVAELQELVPHARRVRALGRRHSFSEVGDTDGILVSTAELPLDVEVDRASGEACVPAAATYAQVTGRLHEEGLALHNLGSLPHISVAGACATATHGSGVGNGCLAAAVTGVELVRGDGELVVLRPDDPDFRGSVVALGSLGVGTRVWLRVEPSYDVAQHVVLHVPVATVAEHAEEVLASAYSVSLFTTW
jgi:xylitol oxidase